MATFLGAIGVPHYTKEGQLYTGATHKDANGRLMSGRTHTANSQFLFHNKLGIGNTPAPLRDRIKGSRVNKKGSAATASGSITFSPQTTASIRSIIAGSRVDLPTAKAVVRRGFGAYSSSYRVGISRVGWGLARLKAFIRKSKGQKVKPNYVQDDDLL